MLFLLQISQSSCLSFWDFQYQYNSPHLLFSILAYFPPPSPFPLPVRFNSSPTLLSLSPLPVFPSYRSFSSSTLCSSSSFSLFSTSSTPPCLSRPPAFLPPPPISFSSLFFRFSFFHSSCIYFLLSLSSSFIVHLILPYCFSSSLSSSLSLSSLVYCT